MSLILFAGKPSHAKLPNLTPCYCTTTFYRLPLYTAFYRAGPVFLSASKQRTILSEKAKKYTICHLTRMASLLQYDSHAQAKRHRRAITTGYFAERSFPVSLVQTDRSGPCGIVQFRELQAVFDNDHSRKAGQGPEPGI